VFRAVISLATSCTDRRTVVALAACLGAAYAYFYQAGGWNQNSRFALVRAIVEERTLRIDDTARVNGRLITGDLAWHDGHVYSDKAPGLALTAAPIVAIARPFVADPSSPKGIATLSYLATVITAGLPTVLTAVMLFALARRLGATRAGGAFASAVFGLGSPAWCYATLFYGHALATACLVGAFLAAVALGDPSDRRRDGLLAAAVGFGGGWATVAEYPTVVAAAMIALLAIANTSAEGGARRARVAIVIAVSALACAAVLAWFNRATLGSATELGYRHVALFEGMSEGFLGVTYPKRGVLIELLVGQYRGLLFLSPVFAAAPIGFLLLLVRSNRPAALTAGAIAAYFVLFNASYHYWDGGWSYGPRHMACSLPFLSLALAPLWSVAKPILRTGLAVIALYGAGLTLVAVSTTAQPPDTYKRPVTQLLWENFSQGRLSIHRQSYLEDNLQIERNPDTHARNIGERLGLDGLASLAPLFVTWGAVGFAWRRRR